MREWIDKRLMYAESCEKSDSEQAWRGARQEWELQEAFWTQPEEKIKQREHRQDVARARVVDKKKIEETWEKRSCSRARHNWNISAVSFLQSGNQHSRSPSSRRSRSTLIMMHWREFHETKSLTPRGCSLVALP